MALPKIDVPLFELELPSNGQKIKYRPFLVKEEKILLMAVDGNDEKESSGAIKQVLQNCCMFPEDFNIDDLPTFDVEYYFLNIRGKSVGESVELTYRCRNEVEDDDGNIKNCNVVNPFEVVLDNVKTVKNKKHKTEIKITKTVGLNMKYPKLDIATKGIEDDNIDGVLDLVVECIDNIYDADGLVRMLGSNPDARGCS